MTTNTTYREKGRAAFLAAIVVLSMVAVPAAFAGSAAADHDPGATDVDATAVDGERFWVGQELHLTGFTGDETVEFVHEDDGFQQRQASSGDLNITTGNWATGDWDIQGGTTAAGNFTLSEQTLDTFEFSQDSTSSSVDLEVASNRAEFNMTLSADGLDAEELNSSFDAGRVAEHADADNEYVVHVTNAQSTLTFDSTQVDTGNYTIEANVVDSTASGSASIDVEEPGETTASFVEGVSEEAGDVASIDIEVDNTDEAWVTIENDEVDGNATVHLTNIDTDAQNVTLDVNTYSLSQGDANTPFSSEDADVSGSAQGPFADIGPNRWTGGFSFTLRSFVDNPDLEDNRPTDRSRLTLEERSTNNLTTWIAPGDTDIEGAENPSDLTEDATQSNTVAAGDVVIAQVDASGIYGYLGDSADNFDPNNENLSFYLASEQTGPFETTTNTQNISSISNAATLLKDADNNQFYVAFAANDVASAGEEWDVVFEVGNQNSYINSDDEEDTQEVNSTINVEETTLDWADELDDNDRLQVAATSESEIGVETNLAPGTEGEIYVETQDATYTEELTVDEDGVATAAFDFSGAENGDILDTIEASLFGSTDQQISTEGVFGEGDEASFVATGDAPGQVDVDADATLDVTVENQGGSSGETTVTVTVDGEEVASESVELDADGTWEESYEIPTGEAGDIEWEVDAGSSSDSGTVTVGETDNGSDDEDTDGEDMDGEDEDGEDADDGDGDGDDGQPGFGVFVALFALIGAALLALRRQN